MSPEARVVALDRLRQLHDCLQSQKEEVGIAFLVEQCEQLIRAVDSFHMEAVRFRMYGLRRTLTSGTVNAPGESLRLVDSAREALQEAGFQTG